MDKKSYVSTEEAARILRLESSTLRHALCLRGSYFGAKPKKLPNGRLLWAREEIEKIIEG